MTGRIYLIENYLTSDKYIGQTVKTIKARFREHIYGAEKMNLQSHLHRAIRKYGKEYFIVSRLHETEAKTYKELKLKLNKREEMYIEMFKKFNKLYNETKGGDGCFGRTVSIETRKKMSDRQTAHIRDPLTQARMTETSKVKTMFENDYIDIGRKNRKCVDQFNIDGTYIITFKSIASAAKNSNTHHSSISNCCLGKRTVYSSGGFIWRYSDDNS